jgi:hypothetical protein
VDLTKVFDQLITSRVRAEQLLSTLRGAQQLGDTSESVLDGIQEANRIAAELIQAEQRLGTTTS